MSKDKQIKEMVKVYEDARTKSVETLGSINEGAGVWYSKAFYTAGYRKSSDVAREMVEMLTNFFSNDQITRHCEVDAEYINEQIVRIANELMEGKRC